jgi:hypothetical protein
MLACYPPIASLGAVGRLIKDTQSASESASIPTLAFGNVIAEIGNWPATWGTTLQAVSAWFREYRKPRPAKQPTAEQALGIREFLESSAPECHAKSDVGPLLEAGSGKSVVLTMG